MRKLNLSGLRFGMLLGVEELFSSKKGVVWKFKCDCGKEKSIVGNVVKNGLTKSCGCLTRGRRKLLGDEGGFNHIFGRYKTSSRIRNLDFTLSKDEFRLITSKPCEYCGEDPKPRFSTNKYTDVIPEPYICNGIDRVNNDSGYIFSNCVPCCSLCNLMKRGLSQSDFMNHVQKISSYPKVN